MVKVVKFSTGSECISNLTPHLENKSNPDPEVLHDPNLVYIENLQMSKRSIQTDR